MYTLIAFHQNTLELWCYATYFPNAPHICSEIAMKVNFFSQYKSVETLMWQQRKQLSKSNKNTSKGTAQARVSTDIFHDGIRRETCCDTHITLVQYPIILAMHSVHFANFFRGIYAAEWFQMFELNYLGIMLIWDI